MKPRWTECHPRVNNLVSKAKGLEERIEKAGWENPPSEGSKIGGADLEIETGGRIAQRPQYWTNQSTIESEAITPEGAVKAADPINMMTAPPNQYGPEGSTLYSHESGSDTTTAALKKSEDRVLGSLQEGDSLRLRKVADAAEDLARRLL